ncbi:MAG: choice-of-anchor L domain-containing protein [Flavobacteriales bacterium]
MAFFCLFLPRTTEGQLVVDDNPTAQQLVQDVLVGNGVQVSNITFTGYPVQTGSFDASNANLMSIDSGVIMSTGKAIGAIGPNDEQSISLFSGGVTGDPDLYDANGGYPVNDVCIIEFDFVPNGDTVKFDYVFGSDEYKDYANGSINDVFGFFISGPGISGPYTNNAENIATIPTTGQPVTLNSVNGTSNPSFYVDNYDEDNGTPPPPYSTDSSYLQYDGHTVVLTAKRAVYCDSTYHMKLAIADGSDDWLSSGVFLKANSFSSQKITINTDFMFGPNDSTLWEGTSGDFIVKRLGDTSQTDTVYLNPGGPATSGVDYAPFPDTLFFYPGDTAKVLTLDAFLDNNAEGIEGLDLDLVYKDPSACSVWDTTNLDFFIKDPPDLILNSSNDTTIGACTDSVKIWATASNGCNMYDWNWNQGLPDDSVHWVSPDTTTTYVVSVSDSCAVGNPTDSITVYVPNFPPFQVHTYNDTTFYCPNESVPVGIDSITGGSGNSIFYWDSLGTDSSYTVNPDSTTTYQVTAVDTCLNDTVTETVTVNKGFGPLQITAGNDTTICAGSEGRLYIAQQSGGTGNISYDWDPGSQTGASTWFQSDSINGTSDSTTYTVAATDSCGVTASDSMSVNLSTPIADFTYQAKVLETASPIHFISNSENASNYFWDFGYEDFSALSSDTVLSYPVPGTYEVTHVVTDQYGCPDTAWKKIKIELPFDLYVPNAFTPDGDGINDVFRGYGAGMTSYHLQIFNRWGEMIFETKELKKGWDGTVDGDPAPTGTYVYKLTAKGRNGSVKTVQGHVSLIR